MWLSIALAAFGFSLASTVRGEIERATTDMDSLRAYYLASGAVERATLELLWSVNTPSRRAIPEGATTVDYAFETGVAHVEIFPEAGKLNVNLVRPDLLLRLLTVLGLNPERAEAVASNIVAWRTPGVGNMAIPMNLGAPTFETPHASFENVEELLNVQGVTPELYYGTYVPAGQGAPEGAPRLELRPGLVDCLSVFGGKDTLDVNTVHPAVLLALGASPEAVQSIVQRRRVAPFTPRDSGYLTYAGGMRLKPGGNTILTIRATAQARTPSGIVSNVKRTVGAMVKYMPKGYEPIHILRWYDASFPDPSAHPGPAPIPFNPPEAPPSGGN